jgi:phosphate transport system permease protein
MMVVSAERLTHEAAQVHDRKRRRLKRILLGEKAIETTLFLFAALTLLTTVGIILVLSVETFSFFKEVSIVEFFTDTRWTPVIKPNHFGILPLFTGSLLIAVGASLISMPVGLASAIYMSEFAHKNVRAWLKPLLEVLAGIPSIVYGFFALTFVTPILQSILPKTGVFNALSASIAVGIMIIPLVASMSEDAMTAVPDAMRQGALALGTTKLEVALKVVLPAAFSGITASFVLAFSRAIGETMIVAIAAGASPTLTLNPLESVQTMTGYMVNISLGDIAYGTTAYKTVFAVGSVLFAFTFLMNIISRWTVKKFGRGING